MSEAIVTGAYGVIGKEIAIGLLRHDINVHLIGRDRQRLDDLKEDLDRLEVDSSIMTRAIDLSSKKHIFNLARQIDAPIDILINNAATAPVSRLENADGIEMQWATNVLGYYWMIAAFEAHLMRSSNPRVINVASYWAGGIDLDDPEFKHRRYNNDSAYRQSKQADRMLSYGLADKYRNRISINACHPGDANSKLSNDLGFGGSESAKQAAATPIFLATSDEGIKTSGCYFENERERACSFRNQKAGIDRLLQLCETY